MKREIFPESRIHPAIHQRIDSFNRDLLDTVKEAVAKHDVLVVGMSQNPWPRQARLYLRKKKIAFEYLEYGSYLSQWRRRLVLKMWTGWPTFPMIWVKGTFVGGFMDLKRLGDSGELDKMLAAERAA